MDDFEIVDLPVDKAESEPKTEKKSLQNDAAGASNSVVKHLEELTQGLQMPSETDAPFHVFFWAGTQELTPKKIAEKAGAESATPVENRSLDDVFDIGDEEGEKGDNKRFGDLKKALQTELQGTKIYAFGKRRIDLVIVGKTEGGYAGLTTYVVET